MQFARTAANDRLSYYGRRHDSQGKTQIGSAINYEHSAEPWTFKTNNYWL